MPPYVFYCFGQNELPLTDANLLSINCSKRARAVAVSPTGLAFVFISYFTILKYLLCHFNIIKRLPETICR